MWEKKIEHVCPLPTSTEIIAERAQVGSLWRCEDPECLALWELTNLFRSFGSRAYWRQVIRSDTGEIVNAISPTGSSIIRHEGES